MSIAIPFQKIEKIVSVSDFRAAISSYLRKAKIKPLIVSADRGGEPFVVLSADAYNTLVEAREDDMDSKELQKLVRRHGKGKSVEWRG